MEKKQLGLTLLTKHVDILITYRIKPGPRCNKDIYVT